MTLANAGAETDDITRYSLYSFSISKSFFYFAEAAEAAVAAVAGLSASFFVSAEAAEATEAVVAVVAAVSTLVLLIVDTAMLLLRDGFTEIATSIIVVVRTDIKVIHVITQLHI
jgi:hypothetical protein